MINIVENIALVLWGIYFLFAIYREIKNNNDSIKEILKHPFHFFRIDNIFFLIIFLIYNDFARSEILPYLYLIIVITNVVYLFYDLVDNYKFEKIKKKEFVFYIIGILALIGLFGHLNIYHDIVKIAIMTLSINLFIPMYVSLIKFIKKH